MYERNDCRCKVRPKLLGIHDPVDDDPAPDPAILILEPPVLSSKFAVASFRAANAKRWPVLDAKPGRPEERGTQTGNLRRKAVPTIIIV